MAEPLLMLPQQAALVQDHLILFRHPSHRSIHAHNNCNNIAIQIKLLLLRKTWTMPLILTFKRPLTGIAIRTMQVQVQRASRCHGFLKFSMEKTTGIALVQAGNMVILLMLMILRTRLFPAEEKALSYLPRMHHYLDHLPFFPKVNEILLWGSDLWCYQSIYMQSFLEKLQNIYTLVCWEIYIYIQHFLRNIFKMASWGINKVISVS